MVYEDLVVSLKDSRLRDLVMNGSWWNASFCVLLLQWKFHTGIAFHERSILFMWRFLVLLHRFLFCFVYLFIYLFISHTRL